MNDDELKSMIENAGDEMPPAAQKSIRGAVAQALQQTWSEEPAEQASIRVVSLEQRAHGRPSSGRWMAIVGAGAVAAAALIAFVVGRDTDPEPVKGGETTHSGASVDATSATTPTPPTTSPSTSPSTSSDVTDSTITESVAAGDPTTSVASASTDPPSPTTVPPVIALDEGVVLPAHVVPTSVSFPTASNGWMVGSYTVDDTPNAPSADSTARTVLLHTTDSGQTWTEVAHGLGLTADVSAYSIAFADELNGWLAGPIVDGVRPVLMTTHDGSATWSRTLGPDAMAWSPMSVASSNGIVSVIAFDPQNELGLYTAAVDSDEFVRSPAVIHAGAGPLFDASIALGGDSGWMVYNDRVLSGSARLSGGRWVDWQTPCSTADSSSDVADVATNSDGSVVVVSCTKSGFADPPVAIRLFISTDGGDTFNQTSDLPLSAKAVDGSGDSPAVGFIMVTDADTIIVAYQRVDRGSVVRSIDRGASWAEVVRFSAALPPVIAYTVPSGAGALLVFETPPGIGVGSTDDGASWPRLDVVDIVRLVSPSDLQQIDLNSGRIFGFDAGNSPGANSPTPEAMLEVVTPVLGEPDLDTGWYVVPPHPDEGGADCWGGGTARVLIWGDLSMLFHDDGTRQFLTNWQLGGTEYPARGIDLVVPAPTPHPTGLVTTPRTEGSTDAFGLGSSRAGLIAAFPAYDRGVPVEAGGAGGFGGLNNSLYFLVGDDADTITLISVENGC